MMNQDLIFLYLRHHFIDDLFQRKANKSPGRHSNFLFCVQTRPDLFG